MVLKLSKFHLGGKRNLNLEFFGGKELAFLLLNHRARAMNLKSELFM